jgi:hypothetical protein
MDPERAKAASFDDAFPNLAKLGQEYRRIRITDLDAILSEESKRSVAELELFGVKIPSEGVVSLGLPSLGVVLWQFALVAWYIAKQKQFLCQEQASQWALLLTRDMTDHIFLAQILGHKLLGPNESLSVGQSYKDFYVVGK